MPSQSQQAPSEVRVDKWLWAARLFKTRSMASRACSSGHVKCNGHTAKASKAIRAGDRLDVQTPGGPRVVVVVALGEKRGPASIARTLYEDRTPPPPAKPTAPLADRDRGAGRPTKRDRRQLRRLRGR